MTDPDPQPLGIYPFSKYRAASDQLTLNQIYNPATLLASIALILSQVPVILEYKDEAHHKDYQGCSWQGNLYMRLFIHYFLISLYRIYYTVLQKGQVKFTQNLHIDLRSEKSMK